MPQLINRNKYFLVCILHNIVYEIQPRIIQISDYLYKHNILESNFLISELIRISEELRSNINGKWLLS